MTFLTTSPLTRPNMTLRKSPLLTGTFLALMPLSAQAVPLTFDQMVGSPSGTSLLGPTATERTLFFLDVATEDGSTVDARITTTLIGDTHFADVNDPLAENYFGDSGYLPDYSNRDGGPQQDLGFLYYGNGVNAEENGITLTLEFFDGTGEMSGTFQDPFLLSSVELAIYDVDGEASQSEYFSARTSDGLVSYALGNSPQALVATDLGDSIRFDGPGQNYAESDDSGAAILYYELTDTLQLSFGSIQSGGPDQNGVFSAIDGDLSLFERSQFADPTPLTPVPLPASIVMLLSALAGCFLPSRHRRRKAAKRRHSSLSRPVSTRRNRPVAAA